MNRNKFLFTVIAIFIIVVSIGTVVYYSEEAIKSVNGFDGFSIETEVIPRDNNSAIIHSVLMVPEEFSRIDDCNVKIVGVRDSYVRMPRGTIPPIFHRNQDLFLGNYSDLKFTRKEGGDLENYLVVPNGKLLDVWYKVEFVEKKIIIISIVTDSYCANRVST